MNRIIFGTGGHAKLVFDALVEAGRDVSFPVDKPARRQGKGSWKTFTPG
jgi:hypothetical protein